MKMVHNLSGFIRWSGIRIIQLASLFDNAPNYQGGCVIQKRYYHFFISDSSESWHNFKISTLHLNHLRKVFCQPISWTQSGQIWLFWVKRFPLSSLQIWFFFSGSWTRGVGSWWSTYKKGGKFKYFI